MPKVKKAASFGHGQFKNGGGGKRPYGLDILRLKQISGIGGLQGGYGHRNDN